MTIYISPNPGKTSASEIALRAAQILLTHGAAVLMSDALRESCNCLLYTSPSPRDCS